MANSKLNPPYEMKQLELLEPFSVVKYMFETAGVAIDYSDVKAFWSHHWEVGSPWASDTTATDQHIPLGLHGDAAKVRQVAFQPAEKVLGIWLNAPLWRPKSVRASRWLLCAIHEADLYQHHTLNSIYHRIVWSLNCLHDGLYPSTGPSGEQLEGIQKERAGTPICGGKKIRHRGSGGLVVPQAAAPLSIKLVRGSKSDSLLPVPCVELWAVPFL